ncbi:MAG: portal protein [Dongiaceae bacterium]
MTDQRATELIARQERLAAERGTIESHWQEIAEFVAPMRAEFTARRSAGEKRQQRIFDATPGMAAENLAAGLWGMVTNSANEWFRIRAREDRVNEDPAAQRWLEDVSRLMRQAFAAGGQRFYARAVDLYADLVTFGTGVFYTEERPEGGVHFACRHLAECYIAENERDEVDTVYRRFEWTARQAHRQWGERCSEAIRRMAEREPERKFTFLHVVKPRDDSGSAGGAGGGARAGGRFDKSFESFYVDVEGRTIVAEGGYYEFPYQVPRWSTRSRSAYGDSPAMLALPDIKMLNAMAKTTIVAAQKAADPPILAPDEASVRGIRTAPGGIIYGGIDDNGRVRYQPLVTGANIGLTLEMADQRRQAVREAFHWSLLLMVAQPNQTATEVLARQEEKLRLMGPHLGRIQSEFLDPLIDRLFGMMVRAGRVPPMPKSLADLPELKIDYVSPAARAQRAGEGQAIVQALQALMPLGAIKPEVFETIDTDAAARAIAEAFGAPASLLRPAEEIAAAREAKEQQAMMQQLAGAAGPISGALKNLAAAGKSGQDMLGGEGLAALLGSVAGGDTADAAANVSAGAGVGAVPAHG